MVREQCTAFPSGLPGGVLRTFVVRLSSTMYKYGKDDGVQVSDYLLDSTYLPWGLDHNGDIMAMLWQAICLLFWSA